MTENHLNLFYITNKPEVALIADKYGVDRVWIDLEVLGKESRQKDLDTVKSKHSISDIKTIKPLLSKAEMLVRVNSWNEGSRQEIDDVINAGADIIMLPFWKTPDEVSKFVEAVNGRCKTTLLLETKEAVSCIDQVLDNGGFDEIHIGLNDLHHSYGMTFMFELLVNGVVENLCNKFKSHGIPYGFGGIARLGCGELPAEKVIVEHYRLGSTRAILSRSFFNADNVMDLSDIDNQFGNELKKIRAFETSIENYKEADFTYNHLAINSIINQIVQRKKAD